MPTHWVIVGGESGPGARPMDATWVPDIRDQFRVAGVPFSSNSVKEGRGTKCWKYCGGIWGYAVIRGAGSRRIFEKIRKEEKRKGCFLSVADGELFHKHTNSRLYM